MTQSGHSVDSSGGLTARFQTLLSGAWTTQVIYVAAELNVADHLASGSRTSANLAAVTESHEPSLNRLLHSLVAIGMCSHEVDNSFELTPLGSLLRSDAPDSLHAWSLWWGRSLWSAWGNLLHSVRTGESARSLLLATRGFDHLSDLSAADTFYRATVELSRSSAQAILTAYDFSGSRRIADIGGGYGELLVALLRANPSASGVLFDLPQAMSGAAQHLESSGIAGRCELIEGDFFIDVPRGCDVYVLKSILHDWTDDRALEILNVCGKAMNASARLLIIEQQVPEGSEGALQSGLVVSDLTMLVAHGSRERTYSEFEALLHAAGFAVTRNVNVAGTLGIIEARPDQDRDLRQNS